MRNLLFAESFLPNGRFFLNQHNKPLKRFNNATFDETAEGGFILATQQDLLPRLGNFANAPMDGAYCVLKVGKADPFDQKDNNCYMERLEARGLGGLRGCGWRQPLPAKGWGRLK